MKDKNEIISAFTKLRKRLDPLLTLENREIMAQIEKLAKGENLQPERLSFDEIKKMIPKKRRKTQKERYEYYLNK